MPRARLASSRVAGDAPRAAASPPGAVAGPSQDDGPGKHPAATARQAGLHEPVWLVRAVLFLFLVGFAAFLAREVRAFLDAIP